MQEQIGYDVLLNQESEEEESEEEKLQKLKRIGNCDLIKDPRLVFACLCGALSYF